MLGDALCGDTNKQTSVKVNKDHVQTLNVLVNVKEI